MREHPAAAGACEEPDLEEVGLDDVFERAGVLVHGGGDGVETDGSAVVDGRDGAEVCAVEFVEAEVVDAFESEGLLDDFRRDGAVAADLGVVACSAEEAVCDAGGAA